MWNENILQIVKLRQIRSQASTNNIKMVMREITSDHKQNVTSFLRVRESAGRGWT